MDLDELLDLNKPYVMRTMPSEIIDLMGSLESAVYCVKRMCQLGHSDMALQSMPFVAYHGEWVRINVEKDLTDELCDTQMKSIMPEDVVPLFDSMEFVFQDDRYPRILFYVKRPEYLEKINRLVKEVTVISDHKTAYCMSYYTKDGISHMLNLPPVSLSGWLNGDTDLPLLPGCAVDDEHSQNELKRQLFTMIVKVMLYASIPIYKPVEVGVDNRGMTRSDKGAFGMPTPGCKRAFIIRPPTIKLRDMAGYVPRNKGEKSPHRRVGHFNTLRSERYKNKRGQLVYVRPCFIHGGTVSDHIYEIRKRGDDGRDGGIQKAEGG